MVLQPHRGEFYPQTPFKTSYIHLPGVYVFYPPALAERFYIHSPGVYEFYLPALVQRFYIHLYTPALRILPRKSLGHFPGANAMKSLNMIWDIYIYTYIYIYRQILRQYHYQWVTIPVQGSNFASWWMWWCCWKRKCLRKKTCRNKMKQSYDIKAAPCCMYSENCKKVSCIKRRRSSKSCMIYVAEMEMIHIAAANIFFEFLQQSIRDGVRRAPCWAEGQWCLCSCEAWAWRHRCRSPGCHMCHDVLTTPCCRWLRKQVWSQVTGPLFGGSMTAQKGVQQQEKVEVWG